MKIINNILTKLHGKGLGKIWPLDLLAKNYYNYALRKTEETLKIVKINDEINFEIFVTPKYGHVDQQIFISSKYEPVITELFCKYIKKKDTVLDIGANIGYYALLSAKLVGERGKIYAFEPSKIIFEKLVKNITHNKLKQIQPELKGCGSENKFIELTVYPEQLGYSRITTDKKSKIKKIKEKINIIKLDDYLNEKISFIKIDVEGYECEVITGLKQTITKYKPTIIIEFSPIFYNSKDKLKKSHDLIDYLMKNYKLTSLKNNKEIKDKKSYLKENINKQDNILCVKK
jgi:FkbM family methyltransferase